MTDGFRSQLRQHRLKREHHAFDVDVHDLVVERVVDIVDCGRERPAGVREYDIHAAEPLADFSGNRPHVLDRTHVALENERMLAEFGPHALEHRLVAARHCDAGAFRNEPLRGRKTDATGTTGD